MGRWIVRLLGGVMILIGIFPTTPFALALALALGDARQEWLIPFIAPEIWPNQTIGALLALGGMWVIWTTLPHE